MPLSDEVTVVLTTSFTVACPSTALIEATLSSFAFVPGLEQCRTVIVADGFLISTRRRIKMGRLLPEDETPYREYIEALRTRIRAAKGEAALPASEGVAPGGVLPEGVPPGHGLPAALANAVVLPLEGHHGFGWAIKAALESGLVATRHILVVQHDRCFMRPFDLARASRCMAADDRIRYLLLPTRSTRNHAQTIASRCGGAKLPHIVVNGAQLLQLGFWWDSTHLATAEHYLDFVFRERCVKRGTFPEDTLGRQLLSDVKRGGVRAADRYHAWLWAEPVGGDEGGDERVVGHLNGAHWRCWALTEESTLCAK